MAKLPHSERYALVLLCLCIFLLVFGETMQPAPRTQIYENIICDNLIPPDDKSSPERCKAPAVQQELVFIKGAERLLGAFPTILAIPYALAANVFGRRNVLTLALVGLFMEETWNFIICWFSPVFKIRLVLAAVGFEAIGGGFSVVTTIVHVIAADITTGEARAGLFFAIHAIGIVAAILGQVTSSLLMPVNLWLPWVAGLCCILLAGAASLFIRDSHQAAPPPPANVTGGERQPLLLPHTDTRGPASDCETVTGGSSPENHRIRPRLVGAWESLQAGGRLVYGQSRLVFLLGLVLLCQMSEDSFPIMLLLYASKRFGWSFAKANLFWALGEGVQLVVLLALLPLVGRLLKRRLGGFAKDVTLTQISAAFLGTGTLLIGLAGNVPVFVAGIVLTASAAGMQSLLRCLITDSIKAEQVSLVYSIVTVLHVVGGALAGPLYSVAFVAGMRRGTQWAGLPFVLAGALGLLSFGLLLGLGRGRR